MSDADNAHSPLETVAEVTGPRATEAFGLLSNETRLAILLALWEAYDPVAGTTTMSFSDLRERVGMRDSGQFNYHLEQLIGRFVASVDGGYELRNSGHKLIRTVIAGTGIEETTLSPTELDMACNGCGGRPVEISYDEEVMYLTCSECDGFMTDDAFPSGTIAVWDVDPAGLAGRTPAELLVAGAIASKGRLRRMIEGVCPDCSGSVNSSLRVCEDHDPPSGALCDACGMRDRVRIDYTCKTCKNWTGGPVQSEFLEHPAVISFYYEYGIDVSYDVDDIEGFKQVWDLFWRQEHTVVSEDPLRIQLRIPCEGDELVLTIDGELEVIDIERDS
jgi:DNA-binding transcriptional ArsR family regulator